MRFFRKMPLRHAFLFSCGFFLPHLAIGAEELVMRAASVIGDVTVDKTPLHAGDSIRYGQKVELGPNAGLKALTVLDRSIFDFTENASVVIAKGDHVETVGLLQLAHGRVRFAVHPRMVWALQAQGIRYELRGAIGAVSATTKDGEGVQVGGTREGSVEVKIGDKKLTTLNDIDRFTLQGKLDGENLPANVRARREAVGGAVVRDWVAASAVDDPVFLQSIQLGATETPRARGITYQFLEPGVEAAKARRPPAAFDDPEHQFSSRASLFELNGSAMQVRQQATIK